MIMKTIKKFFTYGLLIFAMVLTSCSKDGEEGAQGISGTNGIDGVIGTDGSDGTNGTDGEEGNENVETIIFLEPTWSGKKPDTKINFRKKFWKNCLMQM